MTTGPTDEESTTAAGGPGGMPLALRLSEGLGPLVEKLRGAASAGYDEWRVQDPEDGAYCMAYSWPATMSPEREARAWLADQKARFPNGLHSNYVVACVRVVPEKDQLLAEAADTLERQQAEIADAGAEVERMRQALRDIADPIAAWQRDLQPGYTLNGGMCVHMASDPETYRRMARDALRA